VSQYSHLKADLSNENSSVTKIVRLVGRDRLVLDVGCAHGYLSEVLSEHGCRVIGIEIDPEDAARARSHCEQVLVRDVEVPGWIEELGERQFDAVVLSDVLEHLRDPGRVLAEIRGILKPGSGFIVASVPNVAHTSVRLELLLGSFQPETVGILDATHLHFYTRETLHDLLASSGFAVESWDCTINEIGDHVIEDYLQRAGLSYTQELREQLSQFEAMAYQFVVTARPATDPRTSTDAPITKPLKVMHELISDHRRLRTPATALEEPSEGGLKVLQVIHQFPPRHAAGAEIHCSDLSFALARRGHAVRVLSGAPYREDAGTTVQWEDDVGIVVERMPATRGYRRLGSVGGFLDRFDNPDARLVARALLHRWRPDVVHIQHLLYLTAELIPECHARGIPVVVTLHDYWFLCHRVRLQRPGDVLCDGPARGWNCCQCLHAPRLVRSHLNPMAVAANLYRYAYLMRQLRKADLILSPSHFLQRVFARNGLPMERITTIEFGMPGMSEDLRGSTEVISRHERPRFGFLGSFMPHKGIHVLIDAFNRLPEESAELHLFGAPVDPQYRDQLIGSTRHPGIRWRGEFAHAERWRVLAELDVLVVPSIWYENSPLTIHEARAARVPVIASDIGGIPELVHHEVTGLTFPAGDAAALANCLRRVIDESHLIAQWQRAMTPAKTMETHVAEIEEMYRDLCGSRRTPSSSEEPSR
jgi:glycosyltransferase involved in cell wall biosynthesis/SAM-dependent methyltransferase